MKIIQNIIIGTFISTQVLGSELNIEGNSTHAEVPTEKLSQAPVDAWKNLVSELLENQNIDVPANMTDLTREHHFSFLDRHLNFSLPLDNPIKLEKAMHALIGLNIIGNSKIRDNISTLPEKDFQETLHDIVVEEYQNFQNRQFLETLTRLGNNFFKEHQETISLLSPPMVAGLLIVILSYFQSL